MDAVLEVLPRTLARAGQMLGYSLEEAADRAPWAVVVLQGVGTCGVPTHRGDTVATDCGFETTVGLSTVAEEVVWAKLKALRDGAAIASKRLFG